MWDQPHGKGWEKEMSCHHGSLMGSLAHRCTWQGVYGMRKYTVLSLGECLDPETEGHGFQSLPVPQTSCLYNEADVTIHTSRPLGN